MATPDWTTVPDTSLEPGDPIRSIDIIAINNHAAAMAGGATGAPEIKLMAIETLSSGTTIRSRIDSEITNIDSFAPTLVYWFGFAQIGTVNVYVEHKCQNAVQPSTITIYRTRNGATSTIASFVTTSTTYVARSQDVPVIPGDYVYIELSGGTALFPVTARYARFRTGGENLWPGVSVRLENDYTVV